MPKRLAEVEADLAAEQRQAEQWAAQHGGGNTPSGRRFETGETAGAQQVQRSKGQPGYTAGDGEPSRVHRDPMSYSAFGNLGDFEDWLLESNIEYRALVSPSAPGVGVEDHRDRLAKHGQMHHCLSFLTEARVNLLFARHVERMTLDAIAAEEGVTRQAIIKRLRVAEAHLKDAIAEHWDDDVQWEV